MRYFFLFGLMVFFSLSAHCQTWGDSTVKKGDVFYSVQKPPKFPGGLTGFYRFVADHLKQPSQRSGGLFNNTVEVKVYISKTGKIVFAEIEKGIDESHNTAVLEMIKVMPDWSPALQNNRPITTALSLPIVFVD